MTNILEGGELGGGSETLKIVHLSLISKKIEDILTSEQALEWDTDNKIFFDGVIEGERLRKSLATCYGLSENSTWGDLKKEKLRLKLIGQHQLSETATWEEIKDVVRVFYAKKYHLLETASWNVIDEAYISEESQQFKSLTVPSLSSQLFFLQY